jgi:hypothetical protein
VAILADAPPLFLLFEKDRDELASELRTYVTDSHEITGSSIDITTASFGNLRFNGLGFQYSQGDIDLAWSGFKSVFANPDWSKLKSFIAVALGDQVGSGRISPSIVKQMLTLSVALGEELDCNAVLWHPSQIVTGFSYFSEAVEQYTSGGPFPVLAFVDFAFANDGSLVTTGLSWLSGQELKLEKSTLPAMEMMRRAVRISHDIACNGAIDVAMEIDGLDHGERMNLVPSANGQKLHVSIYSKMDQ